MLQISFVMVLAMLWALTFAQPGGADFLKVRVFQQGFTIVRVLDVLTGLGIVGLMVTYLTFTVPIRGVQTALKWTRTPVRWFARDVNAAGVPAGQTSWLKSRWLLVSTYGHMELWLAPYMASARKSQCE